MGYVLPVSSEETKVEFEGQLRRTFEGVFFLPFNMAYVNALVMLLVFDMAEYVRAHTCVSPAHLNQPCTYRVTWRSVAVTGRGHRLAGPTT